MVFYLHSTYTNKMQRKVVNQITPQISYSMLMADVTQHLWDEVMNPKPRQGGVGSLESTTPLTCPPQQVPHLLPPFSTWLAFNNPSKLVPVQVQFHFGHFSSHRQPTHQLDTLSLTHSLEYDDEVPFGVNPPFLTASFCWLAMQPTIPTLIAVRQEEIVSPVPLLLLQI